MNLMMYNPQMKYPLLGEPASDKPSYVKMVDGKQVLVSGKEKWDLKMKN